LVIFIVLRCSSDSGDDSYDKKKIPEKIGRRGAGWSATCCRPLLQDNLIVCGEPNPREPALRIHDSRAVLAHAAFLPASAGFNGWVDTETEGKNLQNSGARLLTRETINGFGGYSFVSGKAASSSSDSMSEPSTFHQYGRSSRGFT
jgi:hypothetical protein